ncbi:proline-tRNA ligase [Rhinocladiella mackenziei CBS 650.93]|uniref:proline--tRNA ligase n=1 Tax=Rhinocladiella mackenziei CBS 650.93 TaxID=1442369 RepID=A0A0D2FQ08_9EURO|nr:proline-tRNA ligase [Rhinocladiella mackenziei CBS 650.93]KIX04297.1 proline-tRNA ligase [Rhinocladiella mackenziei CBS 650.93]
MKHNVLARAPTRGTCCLAKGRRGFVRQSHADCRQRISDFWIPTVNLQKQDAPLDATQLLVRAGYFRQAYAGIFHMLPLGLRVQEKLERLIDKHMRSIKASKVSLSSISSQALWQKSGRFKPGAEFFALKDRKDSEWLLAPTHEEEITTLLLDHVHTRQQLPLRLYQIGRKYRDEKRPRGGLLRGREFLMKDLYTFDATIEEAHTTYNEIRGAYRSFLDELKINYVEARAESGDMGGRLSHEYHFPNTAGEDTVITCSDCDYARNEEFVSQKSYPPQRIEDIPEYEASEAVHSNRFLQEDFLSTDGRDLVRALAPQYPDAPSAGNMNDRPLNSYAIKAALRGVLEVDSGREDPLTYFKEWMALPTPENVSNQSIFYLLDSRVELKAIRGFIADDMKSFSHKGVDFFVIRAPRDDANGINLLKHQAGDPCPECSTGKLRLEKAIEVGHTFHLGTRYSLPFNLSIRPDVGKDSAPVQMGCHGIGVSRLVAAVASCLADESGLNWPRAIAPFETIIIVQKSQREKIQAAVQIYDDLSSSKFGAVDALLDDRQDQGLGWKLKDADMIGYPVIVVIGKAFDQGKVEVQCRRLGIKQDVEIGGVVECVHGLLEQL